MSSTEQGLALTLTVPYQQCEARVAQAAQDTALYTLVSVNGAPVVAGKNPCVNFLNNALVVRLNPITASAP